MKPEIREQIREYRKKLNIKKAIENGGIKTTDWKRTKQ